METVWIKIFLDWEEAFSEYSAEEVGHLFMAMLKYAKDGTVPDFKGNEKYLWPMLRSALDRDEVSREELSKKRAEAGRLGGLANQANAKQNKQMLDLLSKTSKKKKEIEIEIEERDKEEEGEGDSDSDKRASAAADTATTTSPPTHTTFESPPPLTTDFSETTTDTLNRWYAHRKSQGYTFHDPAKRELESEVRENVSKYGDQAVAEVVDYSIAHGYKTLFWDRLEKGKTSQTHIDPDGKKRSGEAIDYEIKHHDEMLRDDERLAKLMAEWDAEQAKQNNT